MPISRHAITPDDYVFCADTSRIWDRPMFVVKHDPYPFEGNPTDNPTAGAAQYNAALQRVDQRHVGSFEGLIDVAQGSVDLAKGILQVYRLKRLTGDFEPFQRGNRWGRMLDRYKNEIAQLSGAEVMQLQSVVTAAERDQ